MRKQAISAVVLGASALTILGVSPSEALNTVRYWPRGTTDYIKVYEDGVEQARAYGSWKVTDTSSGTRSIGTANIKDIRAGGNSAYVEMKTQSNSGVCYAPEYFSCNATWYDHATDQTARTNSDLWVTLKASTTVDSADQYARARLKVCEDQRFSPDPCSGWTYTYGDRY